MKRICTLCLIILIGFKSLGQVTTNGSSGLAASYTSLANAITALNAATITAPVTITLTTGNPQTAPSAGYIITATGNPTNTIIITGAGTGSTISASPSQAAGVKTDAIFKIVGGDYITLQGFDMKENGANTITAAATNTMTEFGIALFLTTATNGAQNNIIQNNTISLSSAYQNAIGIFSSSSSSQTNSALAASSTAGTNSNNKFYGNIISNVAYGMYFICEPVTSTINESGTDIGGTSGSTANTITFGNITTSDIAVTRFSATNSAGVYFRNGIGYNVRFNNITSNNLAYSQTSGLAGIIYTNSTIPTGVSYTSVISDNTINLTNTGTTALTAIDFGSGLNTGTIVGNNNAINLNQTTSAANSAAVMGIKAAYISAANTCNTNTITFNQTESSGALSGATTGITLAGISTTLTSNLNNITINQAGNGTGTITSTIIPLNLSGASTTINALTNTILINQTTSVATGITTPVTGISATAAANTLNITTTNAITIKQAVTGSGSYGSGSINYIDLGSAAHGTANVIGNNFNTTGSTIRSTGLLNVIAIGTTSLTTLCNIKSNTAVIDRVAASGNISFFNQSSTTPSTPADTLSNNSITFTNLAGTGTVIALQELGGPLSPAALNKSICNNTINISGTISGTVTAINFGNATGVNVRSNNITVSSASPTILGTGTGAGISAANANNINNNIFSLQSSATAPTLLQAINASTGGNFQVFSNTFNSLNYTGILSTGSLTSAITIAAGSNNNIYNNTITNVSAGAPGSTGSAVVDGILISGGTAANIYKNKVYGITTACTGAGTIVNGIRLSGGLANSVYNNLIGNLTATSVSSSDAIRGIGITSTTSSSTQNIYYNTVYISASSTGANFGTTGIFHTVSTTSTTSALNLRDNIIVNMSTANGTGLTVAYRRSAGAANNLANYTSSSNNNLFYAGNPSTTNLIYSDGTSTAQSISAYKSGVFTAGTLSPRDQVSASENPAFISTTGSSANYLHINTAVPTQIESGAAAISGYTDDYDGDTRNATTPDIGADEFTGIIADVTPPSIIYTPVSSGCSGANVTLTATITDASGIPTSGSGLPVLYYKINSGSYTSVQGVSIGSNQYTFTFGNGTVGGDIVSYYVVAQDNASTPNLAAYPSAGAGSFSTNPPAVSTPPSTPNIFTASYILNGTYTVGSGGNFTTLTAAVAAYNNACNITGPVIFSLLSNISSGETFPITINSNTHSSATNKLTIKASVTGLNISGSSATALLVLNGADFVTIDGSISNIANAVCPLIFASRDLTITNTNASASSAVIWLQTTTSSDAATNNTVKNCNIIGSGPVATFAGIGSGSASIGPGSSGTSNINNAFINNNISKVQYGIYSQGAGAGSKNTGTIINQNLINTAPPNNASKCGIYVGYENNITISCNTISNISGTSSLYAWGISCGLLDFSTGTTTGSDVTNAIITKNVIGSVRPADTYGVAGIALASVTSGTSLIANNIISDAFTNGTTGDIGAAIYIGGGAGSTTNVFYNAITMSSSLPGGTYSNFALAVNGDNPIVNVKNNIFTNTGSNGSNLNRAMGLAYTTISNLSSNNNDFYVNGNGSAVVQTGTLTSSGFTSYTTVTGPGSWSAASGKDANSLNVLPSFISATNLRLTTANAVLNNVGIPVSITDDIDCATRDASTPDIGVNEFIATNPPAINNVALSTPANCNSIAHTVTANVTSGTNPLTGVILTYSYNGISQAPVSMTGGSATGTSTWTATIPASSPANATVTWSVTATDGTVTINAVSGTSYQDAPLTSVTLTASSSASAVCSGGSFNLTATPNGVPIFSEGFEGSFPTSGWTFINAGSGNSWDASANANTGTVAISYSYSSSSAADAWAITSGQNLIGGQTYTISFWYKTAGGATYPEKLRVTVGAAPLVASQSIVLWNNNGGANLTNTTYIQGTATYTPATTGMYYFGFNCYSDADEFNLYLDDISLTGNFNYTWSSSPTGFTSTTQNPLGVTETVSTTYNVTASYNGCSIISAPGATVAITSPLSGIYSVGAGSIAGQAGHYTTLTAAIKAYNTICLGGPVTFALTDANYGINETFPLTINANTNASSTNTLTIKPNTGVTSVITTNTTNAVFILVGADYITIDGSNSGGTDKSFTLSNTNASSGTTVVWLASEGIGAGATNIVVKNCNINAGSGTVPNFGVYIADAAGTGTGADNDNITIQNNTITKTYTAIYASGSTTTSSGGYDNLTIKNNTIGPASSGTNNIGFSGMDLSNIITLFVTGNTIQNLSATITDAGGINLISGITGATVDSNVVKNITSSSIATGIASICGIYAGSGVTNSSISRNVITGIYNTNTSGGGSKGIIINSSAGLTVFNNMVSDITGYSNSLTDNWPVGIDIEGSSASINLYYNSINLFGSHTGFNAATGSAALFLGNSGNSMNIKNNIFVNSYNNTTVTSDVAYSIYSNSATNTQFTTINYNDYYVGGTPGILGYINGNRTTLLQIQTGFGQNSFSQNILPVFLSTTNLHLNTASNASLDNLGNPIIGIATDIDNETRNTLTPDIGADEFSQCSATLCTWTGATNTDWNIGSNWCGGIIPNATTAVTIPAGLTNYPLISNADAIALAVAINTGASLSMTGTYRLTLGGSAATFANNGTFTMANSDTVIFAGSGTGIVSGSVSFTNVTIKMPVDFGINPVSTITGIFTISNGGSATGAGTHTITYGSNSTLIYNTTSATYTVGVEWNASTTTGSSGLGNPQNVTIKNTNVITMPAGDRRVPGDLQILSGGLTLSGTVNKDLYVGGNWINNGTFTHNNRKVTLNATSGIQTISGTGNNTFYNLTEDNNGATTNYGLGIITIDSSFRVNAGTMDGGSSTFIFKGAMGLIGGVGSKNFYNFQINNAANITDIVVSSGNIHVANSFTNNGTFTQNDTHTFYFDNPGTSETMSGSGSATFGNLTVGLYNNLFPPPATLLNTGSSVFTISGNALTYNSSGSSITSTGTITFALNTAGTSTIKNAVGVTGTSANFTDVQVSTNFSAVATALDFGSGISTISNNLTINNNGSVTNNAPVYGNASTLIYNANTPALTTGLEWSANTTISGAGNPQNVTIQSSNNILLAGDRGLSGNLNITTGDVLNLNNHTLTINGAVSNTGAFTGSAASGLIIGGSAGTVHFTQGGAANVLQTFTADSGGSVTLGDSLYMAAGSAFGTVTANGSINTGDHFVLRSDINGTARVAASSGSINGKVTVERYIATGTGAGPNHKKSWQLLSVPAKGQTIKEAWQENATASNTLFPNAPPGNMVPGYGTMLTSDIPNSATQPAPGFDLETPLGPSIKIYNFLTNSYNGPASTALPLYNKKGYFVFVRGDRSVFTSAGTATPTILRTTGTLFSTAAPPPIDTVMAGKFESIGNPYASAIDIRNITLTGGVDAFFYVWDPRLGGNYNYGAFQTFSKLGGNYVNLLPSPTYGPAGTINNYVQSGQAFLMQATGTNGFVSFTESAKAAGTGMGIFTRQNVVPGDDTLLRTTLYTVKTDGSADAIIDGVLDQFAYNFCDCVDGSDARKAGNTGETLSILTQDTLLAIERRRTLAVDDTIFLHFTGARVQTYQFAFESINLHTVAEGFLEDAHTHTKTSLDLNGNTSVNFTVENVPGSYAPDRFRIVFIPFKVLPVTFTSIKAYKKEKDINVEWKVDNERNIKQYEVEKSANGVDFTLLKVVNPTNNNGHSAAYLITDIHVTEGANYYRIKSVDINGGFTYSSIVKVVTGNINSDINIYPNPITKGQIHLQFNNEPPGKYGIRLLNKIGQLIMERQITHDDTSNEEIIEWDFNLAHGMYQLEITKPDGVVKNIPILY